MFVLLLFLSSMIMRIGSETACEYHERLTHGPAIQFAISETLISSGPNKDLRTVPPNQIRTRHHIVADNWIYTYYILNNRLWVLERYHIRKWSYMGEYPGDGFFISSVSFMCLRYFEIEKIKCSKEEIISIQNLSSLKRNIGVYQYILHTIGPPSEQSKITWLKMEKSKRNATTSAWEWINMKNSLSQVIEVTPNSVSSKVNFESILQRIPTKYQIRGVLSWIDKNKDRNYAYNIAVLVYFNRTNFYCLNDECLSQSFRLLDEFYGDECGRKLLNFFLVLIPVVIILLGYFVLLIIVSPLVLKCFRNYKKKRMKGSDTETNLTLIKEQTFLLKVKSSDEHKPSRSTTTSISKTMKKAKIPSATTKKETSKVSSTTKLDKTTKSSSKDNTNDGTTTAILKPISNTSTNIDQFLPNKEKKKYSKIEQDSISLKVSKKESKLPDFPPYSDRKEKLKKAKSDSSISMLFKKQHLERAIDKKIAKDKKNKNYKDKTKASKNNKKTIIKKKRTPIDRVSPSSKKVKTGSKSIKSLPMGQFSDTINQKTTKALEIEEEPSQVYELILLDKQSKAAPQTSAKSVEKQLEGEGEGEPIEVLEEIFQTNQDTLLNYIKDALKKGF